MHTLNILELLVTLHKLLIPSTAYRCHDDANDEDAHQPWPRLQTRRPDFEVLGLNLHVQDPGIRIPLAATLKPETLTCDACKLENGRVLSGARIDSPRPTVGSSLATYEAVRRHLEGIASGSGWSGVVTKGEEEDDSRGW